MIGFQWCPVRFRAGELAGWLRVSALLPRDRQKSRCRHDRQSEQHDRPPTHRAEWSGLASCAAPNRAAPLWTCSQPARSLARCRRMQPRLDVTGSSQPTHPPPRHQQDRRFDTPRMCHSRWQPHRVPHLRAHHLRDQRHRRQGRHRPQRRRRQQDPSQLRRRRRAAVRPIPGRLRFRDRRYRDPARTGPPAPASSHLRLWAARRQNRP